MSKTDAPVQCTRIEQHVLLVTLNRPEARNAINEAVAQKLGEVAESAERDPDIRVVILTGTGDKAFCAGADLREVSTGRVARLSTAEGGFAGIVRFPRTKPWIAAVNGPALAGGLEIVLACDMAIAVESATFGLPEVKRGLMATEGGLYRLPRALPKALALEMIATGDPIDATRALSFGLINRVVPGHALTEEACRFASAICANAPLAVRESLRIARLAQEQPEATLHKMGHEALSALTLTEDFWEGPRAFLERRQPRWTGR